MTQRIKYHFLQGLFRLFSALADKTGGWRVFVQPKLIIGSLIIGTVLNSCQTKHEEKKESEQDSIPVKEALSKCYAQTSTIEQQNKRKITKQKKHLKHIINSRHKSLIQFDPSFPGGVGCLSEYIERHLQYPGSAKKLGIEGKVIVNFLVEKDGKISDVKILKPLDQAFDAEAIRVVKSMPRWTPGRLGQKHIAIRIVLPITFKSQQDSVSLKPLVVTGATSNMSHCYCPGIPIKPIKERESPPYALNNEILSQIDKVNTYGHFECDLTFDKAGFLSDYFIIQSLDDKIDQQIIMAIKNLSVRNQIVDKTIRLSYDPPSSFEWKILYNEEKKDK